MFSSALVYEATFWLNNTASEYYHVPPLVFLVYAIIGFVTGIVLYSFRGVAVTDPFGQELLLRTTRNGLWVGVLGGLAGMLTTSLFLLRRWSFFSKIRLLSIALCVNLHYVCSFMATRIRAASRSSAVWSGELEGLKTLFYYTNIMAQPTLNSIGIAYNSDGQTWQFNLVIQCWGTLICWGCMHIGKLHCTEWYDLSNVHIVFGEHFIYVYHYSNQWMHY